MIDPEIWTDLDVGRLSRDARLLFIGLISNADDQGRIEAEPQLLRRLIFGYDEDVTAVMVDAWLEEVVVALRSVERYEVDGRQYLWFKKWGDYQKVKHPTDSKLPAPVSVPILYVSSTSGTTAEKVTGVLRSIDKAGYSDAKVTLERVQRVLETFPDRDHLVEALSLVDWETAGKGAKEETKDGITRYRNWVKRSDQKQKDDVSPRLRVSTPV